jgi:phosphoglycolate phosphatase
MAIRAVFFDLDGTLVQTRAASWELFAETNEAFSLGIDTREAFFALFEDNFYQKLAELCGDERKLASVRDHFLGLLRTRYAPPLIPGMADVVRTLAERFTLVVLSSNTIETIRTILTGAGLAHCFAHVFAGDVEPDKAASMRRFLADAGYQLGRRCSPAYDEGSSASGEDDEVILITDTVGDVREAARAGVRAVGVAWGMHREADLRAAGAERVALWPQELSAWLAAEAGSRENAGACACTPSAPCSTSCAPPAAASDLARSASRIRRERLRESIDRTAPRRPAARVWPLDDRQPFDDQLLTTLKQLRKGTPH